jgi:hypothetical protein
MTTDFEHAQRRRQPSTVCVYWFCLTTSLVFGCTSDSSCPTGNLPTCPSSGAPSYATDVAPIFAQQCVTCHSAGGQEPSTPLGTYADVYMYRSPVLDQVDACLMPLGTSLAPADRITLLTWLLCGAPNN